MKIHCSAQIFSNRLVQIALLFGFCTHLLLAEQQKTPTEWLENMHKATSELDYQGVFIYLHGNQLKTMRLEHSHKNGQQQERLMSLDGAPREVVQQGRSILCALNGIQSGSSEAKVTNYLKGILSVDPQELAAYYRFSFNGEERVAGRLVQKLLIEPADEFRYGLNLYLDKEFGLPLKIELLGHKGELISQTMFTQISISRPEKTSRMTKDSAADSILQSAQKHEPPLDYDERKAGWSFIGLPKGFQLKLHMRRGEQNRVEHFVLSDGLTTLSVYIEKIDNASQGLHGASRNGAVNAFGRKLGGYQITAVGEVPEQTVKMVTEAARPIKSGG